MSSFPMLFCTLFLDVSSYCSSSERNTYFRSQLVELSVASIMQEKYYLFVDWQSKDHSYLGYKDSVWKRGEVIFFISLPFIILTYAAAIAVSHYLAVQDSSFSGLSLEPFLFAGLSSLAVAGVIIYLDIQRKRSQSEKTQVYFSIGGSKAL